MATQPRGRSRALTVDGNNRDISKMTIERDEMDIFGQEAEDILPKWRYKLITMVFAALDYDMSESVNAEELARFAQAYKNLERGREFAKFSVKRAQKLLQSIDMDGNLVFE